MLALTIDKKKDEKFSQWIIVRVGDVEFKLTARKEKYGSGTQVIFDAPMEVKIIREELTFNK